MGSPSGGPGLGPWQRLWVVLAAERADLWIVVVYGVAVGALTLVVPIASQALVNWAAFGTVLQPVAVLATIVTGLLLFAGAFRAVQVWVVEVVQRRIFARIALDIAWRLPQAHLESYRAHRPTELVNRFLDVMTMKKAVALILLDGFALLLQTAVGMVLLVLYSPLLLGFALLLFASMAVVIFALGVGAVKTSIAESSAKYEVLGWLEEVARVPLAFRDPRGAALAVQRADQATAAYLQRRERHFRIVFRQVLGSLAIQAFASGLLLGLGGWMVAQQQLTIGQLVAAELVVTPIVGRFARIGKYLETLYDLLAAVQKVGMLFDLPLQREEGERLTGEGPLGVQLRAVTWAPLEGRPPVLDRIELSLPPGSRTAVIGRSGAGKSSLADVVIGLRPPTEGAVEVNRLDLREVLPASLRAQSHLLRDVEVFDGTLLDNVRLNREDVSIGEVREALARVGLLETVSALPEGLETHLSGGVVPISTGEALRLMVARAIVGRPRLMVVDELLDGLDERDRGPLLEMLVAKDAPWTLLVTTHLPELADRLERSYRLEGGQLTEERGR